MPYLYSIYLFFICPIDNSVLAIRKNITIRKCTGL